MGGGWVSLGKFLQMETAFMCFSTRQVHINPPFFSDGMFRDHPARSTPGCAAGASRMINERLRTRERESEPPVGDDIQQVAREPRHWPVEGCGWVGGGGRFGLISQGVITSKPILWPRY